MLKFVSTRKGVFSVAQKVERLNVRVTPMEKLELEKRAERAGMTLTAYILAAANAAVPEQLKKELVEGVSAAGKM